jgi:hypothetical protein
MVDISGKIAQIRNLADAYIVIPLSLEGIGSYAFRGS